jgi:hypothetical protein
MKESKTLSVLNLGKNLLTDKIMSALAQSLVRLLNFFAPSSPIQPIQPSFMFLKTFTSFFLLVFGELQRRNRSLVSLSLQNNLVTDPAAPVLMSSLLKFEMTVHCCA